MEDRGLFIKPTVFSEVTDTMRIAKEEVRGLRGKPCPVLSWGSGGRERGWAFQKEPSPGLRDPRSLWEGSVFLALWFFPSPLESSGRSSCPGTRELFVELVLTPTPMPCSSSLGTTVPLLCSDVSSG